MLLVGSPGEVVRYREKQPSIVKTVYCHIDVLCARSLHPMDEDGLADPCYAIRLEDKIILHTDPQEIKKSLDPLFLNRLIIPVDVECALDQSGKIVQQDKHQHPLPPVLLKMFDRDQNQQLARFEESLEDNAFGFVSRGFEAFSDG